MLEVLSGPRVPQALFAFCLSLVWKHEVNDGSSKPMYVRAQGSSHVSLEEEIMVVERKEGKDGGTQCSQNLHMTFFVLINSVCLILPSHFPL